ncbi:hypothetical protein OSB04_011969 [Centaurea solstitialis]|uniref:Uncharacterized protein n=1 Tax=Centaurea solstitialis TaxID=347529 RepID=A0AA38TAH3_9ASTR|nr:hypothetical protein OSB04_011969 [Centaurea solstitialis]
MESGVLWADGKLSEILIGPRKTDVWGKIAFVNATIDLTNISLPMTKEISVFGSTFGLGRSLLATVFPRVVVLDARNMGCASGGIAQRVADRLRVLVGGGNR